ncbi:unnamed protein product [Enterobius vermicularis]|uniref:Metalloendopeptidase n=1 Tax=Enterobius vermicularis TaxID=51028 RepID=A0A0N4V390_ENTVE|nr:unnamed protein product [Enterobius vermicularis]
MKSLPQILPLSLLILLLMIIDTNADFLTPIDFLNARFVNTESRSVFPLNDQRFHLKIKRHLAIANKLNITFQRTRRGSAVAYEADKWPNGRVPYVLSPAYTPMQRAVIARAIAGYSSKTCIRFVPKEINDRDFIIISKLDGCYADFARVGGPQQVSLADECIDYPTIIHEFMHVIGFIHEHQREDRDGFVNIIWRNVIPGAETDFEKISARGLSYYGEGYDYFSIMHYEASEGSRNGRNTIEAKQHGFTPLMGKSTDFTISDLNRINRAYNCKRFDPFSFL